MAKCKYGEALDALDWQDGSAYSAPEMRTALTKHGQTVGTTTIKTHRAGLCSCSDIYESAAPGPTDEGVEAKPRVDLPKPSLDLDADGGTIVTAPRPASDGTMSEADILAEFELSADDWFVLSVGKSRREANTGEWFESYRATFKPRKAATTYGMTPDEIEDVLQNAADNSVRDYVRKNAEPVSHTEKRADSGYAFLAPAGDLQVGKIDGTGTRGILDRFAALTHQVAADYASQSAKAGTIVASWLGDCIEGITSQGGRLATRQDLWVTEEVRLIQRLIMLQVEVFGPLCERLIIPVVPGNHDENTRFVSTGGTDSWAVHAGSSVYDTIRKINEYAPGTFDHVEFMFPQRGELSVTLDVCGSRVVNVHGHQFRGGVVGAEKWLSGHSLSGLPEGDADILLTAHLHHAHMREVGRGQLICQIPALDGGSDWFRQRNGSADPAGMMSLMTKDGAWNRVSRYTWEGDK